MNFLDKNEYRASAPLSDKHKFGYELGENRHFHHTTTDEDGVRLGCYGHVLEGKKYSTQYVADAKGYRTVPTHDLITVYPKSGDER
jgi:Insect cuticle protein